MKKTFRTLSFILACMLWLGLFSAQVQAQGQPQLEKLAEEQVDQADWEHAKDMADQILSKMAEGSYYEFSEDEATPQVRQQFNAQFQEQAYNQIKSQLGEYQSDLEYKEAYTVEQAAQNFTMYRFQSEFGKMTSEVRMIYTPDDQLAGLFVIPWSDEMK
jgi:hypothetical protein